MKDSRDVEHDGTDPRRWLDAGENVIAALTGDGASLFATSQRVVLVREGSEYRPRNGVRSWPYDRIAQVSLVRPMHGQARIVIVTDNPRQRVSVFFDFRRRRDAERLASEIRRDRG